MPKKRPGDDQLRRWREAADDTQRQLARSRELLARREQLATHGVSLFREFVAEARRLVDQLQR